MKKASSSYKARGAKSVIYLSRCVTWARLFCRKVETTQRPLKRPGNFAFTAGLTDLSSVRDYAHFPFLTQRSPMKRGNFHGCG